MIREMSSAELKSTLTETLRSIREPISDAAACQKCGRRDGLDCVIPDELWNQIEAETGYHILCAWCLDFECEQRGWEVRCLLAFCGKAIYGSTSPVENDDIHWENQLENLNARLAELEEALTPLTFDLTARQTEKPRCLFCREHLPAHKPKCPTVLARKAMGMPVYFRRGN
jgi:ribosomal protein L29